uniref:Disease resistance protein RGA2-like n=1 Tax=Rhizophora mucronata TaxID=61149 RepID=A0A2P2K4T3_RHIMU
MKRSCCPVQLPNYKICKCSNYSVYGTDNCPRISKSWSVSRNLTSVVVIV